MDLVQPYTNGRPQEPAYLLGFWNVLNRHRLLALGVPLLILAATTAFVLLMTPIYQADSSLRVDQETPRIPMLDALKTLSISTGASSKLATEMSVLGSRTLAEGVVDSLGLALTVRQPRRAPRSELFSSVRVARTAPEGEYTLRQQAGRFVASDGSGRRLAEAGPGEPLALPGASLVLAPSAGQYDRIDLRVTPFEKAVLRFRKTLSVDRPDRDADVIAVKYEGSDPALVQSVPNTLMTLYLARRRSTQGSQGQATATFLRAQIDTLNVQLRSAEDGLRSFRERHQVISPEAEAKAEVASLVDMRAQRDVIDAERTALARLLDELRAAPASPTAASPLRRLIAFPTLLKNPAASEMLRSLTEIENQRQDLLSRRTPEDPDVQALTERVHQLEQQLAGISTTYLQGLSNQVDAFDGTLARFSSTLDSVPATEIAYARLERQAKLLGDIYVMLQTRLKESEISAAGVDPTVRVVDPAILPFKPVRPNIPLSLAMALVVGLVLGTGLAFTREYLDGSVRTHEDLRHASGDVPVLATIPRLDRDFLASSWPLWRRGGTRLPRAARQTLAAASDPNGAVSEAYRSLRTNITFARPERAPTTLVFTSAEPGDGKSTSTGNLAATLARQGVRCVLVDADLRRGVLHEVLGTRARPGLSDLLLGAFELPEVVQRVELDGDSGFDFLPAGTLPPNPAELLGSERMTLLLARLKAEYEMVLLDAPPLNLVTDAAVLGTRADGVILVARAGVTERGALQWAVEQLRAVRAPILGSVLNGIDRRRGRYYGIYAAGAYGTRGTS